MTTSRKSRSHRPGWTLCIVLAAVVIAAASWYLLPALKDQPSDTDETMVSMLTTDDVNLRSGPDTTHDVIAVVPTGTEVAVGADSANGFVHVEVNGQGGWMAAEYLSAPNEELAQVQSVQAAEHEPVESSLSGEPVVDESATEAPVIQDTVVQEAPPEPEPTTAPVYEPVVAESTQVQDEPQPGEKWIEVNRTTRTVTLHNGEIVVAQFDALIGKDPSADGYYSTAVGTYYVHVKEKSLVETPFAEGVFLTDFVGFDPDRSNGFHSPVRDADGNVVNTGGTSTLGCVRLSEQDAIFLFDFATVGMRVEIHD